MMKPNLLTITLLSLVFNSEVLAQDTYELVWSDEFNYTGAPDENKWSYDLGDGCPNVCGWGNNESQFYTNRPENVFVDNDMLTIRAIKENYDGKPYTSTRLVSREKGDWRYGKIEVRAKLPAGRGTWPAIWMLPTDWEYGGWPDSGEIDIMEHVGFEPEKIHGTVHTKAYNHSIGTQRGANVTIPDCETEFHVYKLVWTSQMISMFVDDHHYFTFQKEDGFEKWPFDKRFHLLMNIAVGGNWGGQHGIDENIFPQEMKVDYVRVYQYVLETGSIDPEMEVYPNPGKKQFKVRLNNMMPRPKFQLTNVSGKSVVFEVKQTSDQFEFSVPEARAGMYLLTCRQAGELIKTERIWLRP